MANRTVYGLTHSSNGWPMVDGGSCTWVNVPGTNVTLQIQNGWPLAILRAFAADFNAYVEPLRDPDSACWTATNSVASSNHLSGTAMDLNWNSHPFQVANAGFDAAKIATLRELLDFYEGTVFWGNDWTDPKDAMHFQLSSLANGGNINTYGNPAVGDFIARKIRADGYSTFRRGTAPRDGGSAAVDVLARAMAPTGVGADRLAALLPAVSQCLRDCGCTTVDRIAMWCAQIGHESAGLRYMEEIASGAAYEGRADLGNTQPGDGVRFKGRGPIQVTGRRNYTELSRWAYDKGLVPSPSFFVDNPAQLASDAYGFVGVTWYWTTQRPMNDAADARDIVRATQYVNGGQNGIDDRRNRYNRALAMGDQLLTLTAPTEPIDPLEEFLMIEVHSWSIYAKPGEPKIPVYQLIQALDAHGPHEPYWENRARAGDPAAIQDLARVAANGPWNFDLNRYVDDPAAKRQALSVLLEIQAAHPEWITAATPGKA
jgi:putative chitinase